MKYAGRRAIFLSDDVGYSAAWVDGDPLGKEYRSFVGIGTGTGTREMKNKQQKYLFSIDAKSSSGTGPQFPFLLARSKP